MLHGRRSLRTSLAFLALVGVLLAAPSAHAEDSGPASKFFFGLTSALCTLVYTPAKIVYALSSLPVGGLVYMWSVGNTEMTERVIRSGTQGNWMVTPEHLRGQKSLVFVGEAAEGPDPKAKQRR